MDRFEVEIWYEDSLGENVSHKTWLLAHRGIKRLKVVQDLYFSGFEYAPTSFERGKVRYVPGAQITQVVYIAELGEESSLR